MGLETRHILLERAKALGIPAVGKNAELTAAIATAEASVAGPEANQGGIAMPANDPGAELPGEAGTPPTYTKSVIEPQSTTYATAVMPAGREVGGFRVVLNTIQGPRDITADVVDLNIQMGSAPRTTVTPWWCPACDNSQLLKERRCAKCGRDRE